MKQTAETEVQNVVEQILADYDDDRNVNKIDIQNQPDKQAVNEIVEKLLQVLYPGYYREKGDQIGSLKSRMAVTIEEIIFRLEQQIRIVLPYGRAGADVTEPAAGKTDGENAGQQAEQIALRFMERIPKIREVLETDIEAAYEGDPAAESREEIIYCYPGLYAISVYRLAHELWNLNVPMIPRIMTEYAHSRTGIDIHPGAVIGKCFFIDHGTGIVIGETTVIGEHVKIYQGVTLGGLSTSGGQSLRGTKRHPTIGNHVTIYSGASILGGKTVIGDDVVVGGNTFIVNSLEKGTRVSAKRQELKYGSAGA